MLRHTRELRTRFSSKVCLIGAQNSHSCSASYPSSCRTAERRASLVVCAASTYSRSGVSTDSLGLEPPSLTQGTEAMPHEPAPLVLPKYQSMLKLSEVEQARLSAAIYAVFSSSSASAPESQADATAAASDTAGVPPPGLVTPAASSRGRQLRSPLKMTSPSKRDPEGAGSMMSPVSGREDALITAVTWKKSPTKRRRSKHVVAKVTAGTGTCLRLY